MRIRILVLPALLLIASVLYSQDTDALIRAATKGNVSAMKALLENGVNVNARHRITGWTALIAASYYGHPEAVEVLIRSGADVNVRDFNGGTALIKAVTLGPYEDRAGYIARKAQVIRMLLNAGADAQMRDPYGAAVWEMPFDDEIPEFVEVLDAAAVKGVREEELLQAIDRSDLTAVQAFVAKGADVNLPTAEKDSCWIRALMWGNPEIIQLLFQNGADVNATLQNKTTPLMVAITLNNAELVAAFIKAGAQINTKNDNGQTALSMASQAGNQKIIQLLREAGAKQ